MRVSIKPFILSLISVFVFQDRALAEVLENLRILGSESVKNGLKVKISQPNEIKGNYFYVIVEANDPKKKQNLRYKREKIASKRFLMWTLNMILD